MGLLSWRIPSLEIPVWGIYSQTHNHLGKSSVMVPLPSQRGIRHPTHVQVIDPKKTDITGAIHEGQILTNKSELL
jgi:hypothetical protein